jgi:hypothetical protein
LFNDGAKRASKEDIVLFDNRWLMGGTERHTHARARKRTYIYNAGRGGLTHIRKAVHY